MACYLCHPNSTFKFGFVIDPHQPDEDKSSNGFFVYDICYNFRKCEKFTTILTLNDSTLISPLLSANLINFIYCLNRN